MFSCCFNLLFIHEFGHFIMFIGPLSLLLCELPISVLYKILKLGCVFPSDFCELALSFVIAAASIFFSVYVLTVFSEMKYSNS